MGSWGQISIMISSLMEEDLPSMDPVEITILRLGAWIRLSE
jgi:hypothetical protein